MEFVRPNLKHLAAIERPAQADFRCNRKPNINQRRCQPRGALLLRQVGLPDALMSCVGRRGSIRRGWSLHWRVRRQYLRLGDRAGGWKSFRGRRVEHAEFCDTAVKQQDQLLGFDLSHLPAVDVVADLDAETLGILPNTNNGARIVAVHDDREQHQIGRRRRRWRDGYNDWRRRRRAACWRKKRPVARGRQLIQ